MKHLNNSSFSFSHLTIHRVKFGFFVILALILCVTQLATAQTTSNSTTSLTEANIFAFEEAFKQLPGNRTLMQQMEFYRVPGVSIAVINHGTIEWTRGYGVVEADGDQPITPETLFQAASISKPLTAMAVLHLVETGRLDLDKDANSILTSWEIPSSKYSGDAKVTLRGLLSHSAGLTVHGFLGYAYDEIQPTLLQILDGEFPANSEPIRVFTTPGKQWQYSGGGYTVIQQLLEDVLGKPFPDIMQEEILEKLSMEHSTYEQPLPLDIAQGAAVAHRSDGRAIEGKWHIYPEMAAAGLWTTPSDLARYLIEIQQSAIGNSNTILSKEMTRQMLTPQIDQVGLRLFLGTIVEATQWFEHGGANEGFRCLMFAFVETGQGVVIMTNSDGGDFLIPQIFEAIKTVYKWPMP